jgi:flagellin
MLSEKFNGITLFNEGNTTGGTMDTGTSASTLTVVTSHDGDQTIAITRADLNAIAYDITNTNSGNNLSIGSTTGAQNAVDSIQTAIQNLATLRANNGAEQSRLSFASELLTINKANLEAATSRITDVDVAAESTQLARWNTMVSAGTSMLSQANQSAQTALKLLQ